MVMISKESRKEAVRKFKEKKPSIGIYAVRSGVTGHAWVGMSRNLEASKNSCWFSLRIGSHQEKTLQQEWNAQGESAFTYEILDRLDEDVHPLEIFDQLKQKKSGWVTRLNAQQLL
jgi:hypothetical protein